MTTPEHWYCRPAARHWRAAAVASTLAFHRSFPGYAPTPLTEVPTLAAEFGVARVFIKDESGRMSLPSFKILGAAYAVARAISEYLGVPDHALQLDELRERLEVSTLPSLIAATDGNHGRAVAHMARLLGLPARIFVPESTTDEAKRAVESEGAEVTELALEYDEVVAHAKRVAAELGDLGIHIQDTSWPGYEKIPGWIVDGYLTLFEEIDAQLAERGIARLDLVAVPVGVGSLILAALRCYRLEGAAHRPSVLSVEADRAPSILASLSAGQAESIHTSPTIMAGLNCGTPSASAWPDLRDGLDAAVAVTDEAAAQAVHDLEGLGVDAGPCGASTLAGIRAAKQHFEELELGPDSVVVLLSTESRAANPLPAKYQPS